MPKLAKPITDIACRNAKPKEGGKPRKIPAGDGLYLLVTPSAKLWRWKYRKDGVERLEALGAYPAIGIPAARAKRDELRAKLAEGGDPAAERRAAKARKFLTDSTGATFGHVAKDYVAQAIHKGRAPATLKKYRLVLDNYLLPAFGDLPARELTAADLLALAKRSQDADHLETAHRIVQMTSRVMRFAVATLRSDGNPADAIKGALLAVKPKHHAAVLEPAAVGMLLRQCHAYPSFLVSRALRLMAYCFPRPGELRAAEWSEFQLAGTQPHWTIHPARQKSRRAHTIPLAEQAVTILRELKAETGDGKFVFPSNRGGGRTMSEVPMNAALKALGYDTGTMTPHGFRSIATSLMAARGERVDIVELQMAHQQRDKVRAAYLRHDFMPERRELMQRWADYLDELAAALPEDR